MLNTLRSLAIEQIHSLEDHKRLIILHPSFSQQHLIMAELLNNNAAYIRFDQDMVTLDEIQQHFDATLASYGMDEPMPESVILDEYDRYTPESSDLFLANLLEKYPNSRFYVFTRQLPQGLMDDEAIQTVTSFVPSNSAYMLTDYASPSNEEIVLEVRAFGSGQVIVNGKPIDQWDGVLPRALFFYLVDRGMTTRNQIFETFWPNLTTKEATNVFHVTKRKISEILGFDLTKYWSGFYRISPNIDLHYDVVVFNEKIQNSAISDDQDEALDLLQNAIGLYRGHFLNSLNMPWTQDRRDELFQDYGDALASLAELRAEAGHLEEALGLYMRALNSNRLRDDLVTNILKLHKQLGLHVEAVTLYNDFERELQSNLGLQVPPQIQDLVAEIEQELVV